MLNTRKSAVGQRSLAAGAALAVVLSSTALASSHREAPFITQFPKIDASDFYVFNSYEGGRGDYVTLIANYLPLQDAYGGPNYFSLDSNALYEIHVDNNGDAIEDLTFQFTFSQELSEVNGAQLTIGSESVAAPLIALGPISAGNLAAANVIDQYSLSLLSGDRRSGDRTTISDSVSGESTFLKPLDYIGEKTLGDSAEYTLYAQSLSNSGSLYNDIVISGCPAGAQQARVFVGQRKDSFSVNLGRVFDLINLDPINGSDDPANDDLRDKNVTTLAMEVHRDCLRGTGNGVIGAWTTASKRQISILNPQPNFNQPQVSGGAWTQLSRLGSPLVNELVIGIADKNRFNSSEPVNDAQFANYVTHPTLPAIIDLVFNANKELSPQSIAPAVPRNDLVAAFLTGVAGVNQMVAVTPSEMLRLNTGIDATARDSQSNLGVAAGDLAGFPNGRRPGDDVVDIALRAIMGAFCHAIPVDLNADAQLDENDNLLLCGDTAETSRAAAPVGTVGFTDAAPQNAAQFDAGFPYLTTPVPGAIN